jgi:hypothetical protein
MTMGKKLILVVIGVLIVAALGLGAAYLGLTDGGSTMEHTPTQEIDIASVDASAPAHTETATFAMG